MEFEIKAFRSSSFVTTVEDDQVGMCSSSEEQVEAVENSHHVIAIPEPQSCRICGPDEKDRENNLVELGCGCKGEIGSMHRKCIPQWFGPRMLVHSKFKCEICKIYLHMDTIDVVTEAVSDREIGGRAILMEALKKQLALFDVWMPDIEGAADFDELVEVLTWLKAVSFFTLGLHMIPQQEKDSDSDEIHESYRHLHLDCTWPLLFTFVAMAVLVGGYANQMGHFFGSTHH